MERWRWSWELPVTALRDIAGMFRQNQPQLYSVRVLTTLYVLYTSVLHKYCSTPHHVYCREVIRGQLLAALRRFGGGTLQCGQLQEFWVERGKFEGHSVGEMVPDSDVGKPKPGLA